MIFSVFLQYMLERPLWTTILLFSNNYVPSKFNSGISHTLANIRSGKEAQTSLEGYENCMNSHSK